LFVVRTRLVGQRDVADVELENRGQERGDRPLQPPA
jgi:hypothetical protein